LIFLLKINWEKRKDDLATSSTLPSFQIRNNMYNKKNIATIKEGGFQLNSVGTGP
jgi:hypothetical protein